MVGRRHHGRMKQRVTRVAVAAVLVALLLLALPLAAVARAYLFADERGELERDALTAAVAVGPEFSAGDPVELPPTHSDGHLGVYDGQGRLRTGTGPDPADAATRTAATGAVAQRTTGGEVVVAVPVLDAEHVIGVVRASAPTRAVWQRVLLAWAALAGAAALALTAALALARRQARSLTAPLENLAATSRAITDGDLTARAAPCAIPEIDQVAAAHNIMVQRLAHMLQHERDFTANASHQLRTPLTGLQLGLETALSTPGADLRQAAQEAFEQSRHLEGTIDEVLRLAKAGTQPTPESALQSAGEILDRVEHRWHGSFADDGRRLTFTAEPAATALALPGRTGEQILDILLDNARTHGHGTVTVTLREVGEALALDVTDEGTVTPDPQTLFQRGSTTGTGSGIGLALAKDLAEAEGGRLALTCAHPTRFTLLITPPR